MILWMMKTPPFVRVSDFLDVDHHKLWTPQFYEYPGDIDPVTNQETYSELNALVNSINHNARDICGDKIMTLANQSNTEMDCGNKEVSGGNIQVEDPVGEKECENMEENCGNPHIADPIVADIFAKHDMSGNNMVYFDPMISVEYLDVKSTRCTAHGKIVITNIDSNMGPTSGGCPMKRPRGRPKKILQSIKVRKIS